MGDVEHSAVEAGVEWIEHVIAHSPAIDAQFVESRSSHIDAGMRHFLFHRERLAEVGSRKRIGTLAVSYPVSMPLGTAAQTRLKGLHTAVGLPVTIVGQHAPVVSGAGLKRLSLIAHQHAVVLAIL